MGGCEQFAEGSHLRKICEGTAPLPLDKINGYRARWGLRPLDERPPDAEPIRVSPPPARAPMDMPHSPRAHRPRSQKPRAAGPVARNGGCGGCSKRRAAPKPDGHGPGSQLMRMMDEAGVPHCQACIDLAGQMDAWGPLGCTERLGEITEDILPRAREWLAGEHSWAHALLSVTRTEDVALRLAIRQKVQAAIERVG